MVDEISSSFQRRRMEEVGGCTEGGRKRGWTCSYAACGGDGGYEPTSHMFVQGVSPTAAGTGAVPCT